MARIKPTTIEAKRFYRYTFDMRKEGVGSVLLHTLLINPEELTQDEPARNNVTQTLGGVYITDFGSGVITVNISGTSGYGRRTSAEGLDVDGYEEFVNFRQKVYRNFISSPDPTLSLYWYNWEDNEYYEIQPNTFSHQRSKASPLYRYNFRFTCLRKLTETRGVLVKDYLLHNPATRTMALSIASAISTISELLNKLTGKE